MKNKYIYRSMDIILCPKCTFISCIAICIFTNWYNYISVKWTSHEASVIWPAERVEKNSKNITGGTKYRGANKGHSYIYTYVWRVKGKKKNITQNLVTSGCSHTIISQDKNIYFVLQSILFLKMNLIQLL